ncbi:TPA: division/cell wall cluster transcriptional repressor MraZ [Candidatus Poribacteria bacterium]|nr:division/cell wall cluster transcriptional repressor MraZ [Candidatus Poribacteria bacterium]
MFIGEYNVSIDSKGRVCIPAKIREIIAQKYNDGKMILTLGLDGCLALYPYEEWEKIAMNLKQKIPLSLRTGRILERSFFRNAIECSIDKQGRIVIPPKLRRAALIIKDVVIIGVQNRMEIWSKEAIETYDVEFEDSSIGESLEELYDRIGNLQF